MTERTERSAHSTLLGAMGAVKELNATVGHRRVGAAKIQRAALHAAREARVESTAVDATAEVPTGTDTREATAAPAPGAAAKNSKQWSRSHRCCSAVDQAAIMQTKRIGAAGATTAPSFVFK